MEGPPGWSTPIRRFLSSLPGPNAKTGAATSCATQKETVIAVLSQGAANL